MKRISKKIGSIRRRASKKIHETVTSLVCALAPASSKPRILDLGGGHGRLSLMLAEQGYSVVASEVNPSIHKAGKVECIHLDLNEEIKIDRKFDVVLCTEVIEHLYSPKKLFRDAHRLLSKDGVFIFTTPNNENWFSRLHFFLTGMLPSFPGKPHGADRAWFEPHITPIFMWQVRLLISGLFRVEKVTFNRSVLPLIRVEIPVKNLLFGQNLIVVLRKIE